MKKLLFALLFAACVFSAGCSMNHNVHNQIDATGLNFTTAKKGTDCANLILGIIPVTKMDIDKAAKKAGIRSLKYVEYSYTSYILYSQKCVVVYGY